MTIVFRHWLPYRRRLSLDANIEPSINRRYQDLGYLVQSWYGVPSDP